MNYQGKGKLIGFKSYIKDNKEKFVYNILNGDVDKATGLFNNLELITVIQDEQTLKDLKPQEVSFEVATMTFKGQTKNRHMNVRPTKEA